MDTPHHPVLSPFHLHVGPTPTPPQPKSSRAHRHLSCGPGAHASRRSLYNPAPPATAGFSPSASSLRACLVREPRERKRGRASPPLLSPWGEKRGREKKYLRASSSILSAIGPPIRQSNAARLRGLESPGGRRHRLDRRRRVLQKW
jgi:hypothetical protein